MPEALDSVAYKLVERIVVEFTADSSAKIGDEALINVQICETRVMITYFEIKRYERLIGRESDLAGRHWIPRGDRLAGIGLSLGDGDLRL